MSFFIIDNTEWDVGCTVERVSTLTASQVSGLMLDKSYFNDVIGTYMQYNIHLAVPFGQEHKYDELYEIINQPVDHHSFVLPYANGVVEVEGRIQNIKDVYVRVTKKNKEIENHWKGIQFTIVASYPTRYQTLDESIVSSGFSALPPDTDVSVGEIYVYGQSGWEELQSGDDNYY